MRFFLPPSLCLAAVMLVAAPAAASTKKAATEAEPVVTSPLAADGASVEDLLAGFRRAYRGARVSPGPKSFLDAAHAAVKLFRGGSRTVNGRSTLATAGQLSVRGIRSAELQSPEGANFLILDNAFGELDLLFRAAAAELSPSEAMSVRGSLDLLTLRVDRAANADPALLAVGQPANGWAPATYAAEGDRGRTLLDAFGPQVGAAGHTWLAEQTLTTCATSFGGAAPGARDVTAHLDQAARAKLAPVAVRRIDRDRGWAGMCEIDAGAADKRAVGDTILALWPRAFSPTERTSDPLAAPMLELAFATVIDELEAAKDGRGMTDRVERLAAMKVDGLDWKGMWIAAFDAAVRARLVIEARAANPSDVTLDDATLDKLLTRVDRTIDKVFPLIGANADPTGRVDLTTLDAAARADLTAALTTYKQACATRWDMPDRAIRAQKLLDALAALPPAAEAVAPPATVLAPSTWPDALGLISRDVATLATTAHATDGWAGDATGERFPVRDELLRETEATVHELALRARMSDILGLDARRPYAQGLAMAGLAHAAAGDPLGAQLLFSQAEAADPGVTDAPLPELGRSPNELRMEFQRPSEVRPVLLLVPESAPELTLTGAESELATRDLAEGDLRGGRKAWFDAEPPPGHEWRIAFVPAKGSQLSVGGAAVGWPEGDEAVVGRLQAVGNGWAIGPYPLPTLGS